jgi:hypothetical protein
MSKQTLFRQYAEDCVRLAGQSVSAEHKKVLLSMGFTWKELAGHETRINEMIAQAKLVAE